MLLPNWCFGINFFIAPPFLFLIIKYLYFGVTTNSFSCLDISGLYPTKVGTPAILLKVTNSFTILG